MNFKFKKIIYSFFGFLVVLSIADRIDEYLLRQELKRKYSLEENYRCFDIWVKDHLIQMINTENEFGKFCVRNEQLDTLPNQYSSDFFLTRKDGIYIPLKPKWTKKFYINDTYIDDHINEHGHFIFAAADSRKRLYLKEEYR